MNNKRDAASDDEEDVVSEEEEDFYSDEDDASEEEAAEGSAVKKEAAAEGKQAAAAAALEGPLEAEQLQEADEEEAEEAEAAPRPAPAPRRRLQPYEVPASGDFWLHDDRFAGGGASGAGGADAEDDGGRGGAGDGGPRRLWDPFQEKRWGHDAFEALEKGEEVAESDERTLAAFGRMNVGGRGRGRGRERGRGRGRGRGGYEGGPAQGGYYDAASSEQEAYEAPSQSNAGGFAAGEEDFPPPGFEHSKPARGRGRGRGGRGGGRGGEPGEDGFGRGRGHARRGSAGRGRGRGELARGGRGPLTVPRPPSGGDLNARAQDFAPGPQQEGQQQQQQQQQQQPAAAYQQQLAVAAMMPAPASAGLAANPAQQQAMALHQIALGGGAPSMAQHAAQQQYPMHPMQYMAALPGAQPGLAYVPAVSYALPAGYVAVPSPGMPAMPAQPLPPQPVKRPLAISAPADGGSGEALPQRAAGGGRRYSANRPT